MAHIGIDYGMGTTNRDPENGIRYGVISQHDILQAWADSSEPQYGDPTCPKCGGLAIEYDVDKDGSGWPAAPYECADFMCESCEYVFGNESAYGDEPQGYTYSGDRYEMVDCLDSDVMVLKSPYYTFAQFCSPCVPGACNLDSPMDDGVKCYALGHDWFEDGVAPYPVYDIVYDVLVEAPRRAA